MRRLDRTDRACLAAALLVAGAVSVVAASAPRRAPAAGADLQRLVGGVGAGTALDLSRCAYGFDPRVGTVCDGRHEPLPGGGALCPRHAGLLP
jgi:hypothetical protein